LIQVGMYDCIVELQPPDKAQRYQIIKNHVLPESFSRQEVKLQSMT
jgi:hypothetical protein